MIAATGAAGVITAALIATMAFGAGWRPARRASRTQPMMALRDN